MSGGRTWAWRQWHGKREGSGGDEQEQWFESFFVGSGGDAGLAGVNASLFVFPYREYLALVVEHEDPLGERWSETRGSGQCR